MNPTELANDLRDRMRPSVATAARARQELAAHPDVRAVYSAIVFPDKEYGWWTAEQTVLDDEAIFTDRNAALGHACELLGTDRPGTIGYVVHRRGEQWAVFEDILTAADYQRLEVAQ